MSPWHTWTIALIGAMVVWLSTVGDAGPASMSGSGRILSIPTKAGLNDEIAKGASINLVDVLASEMSLDRFGRETSDDSSSLLNAFQTGLALQEGITPTLPATFVLVNIPQARLWMVRNGKIEGSMRVIVGRHDQPTPAMTTELTHIILNPRWNVPQDIVRSSLAPEAARTQGRSLTDAGFEVLSSWQDDAIVVPVAEIDWQAVASGRLEVPVRQKPGAANAMGSAKFVMTNDDGIYLHDTPDMAAFQTARRTLSAGCIRVEDYRRLVKFLVPQPLPVGHETDRPTYVRLGAPMPIYLTYVSAISTDEGSVLFGDPYELDS